MTLDYPLRLGIVGCGAVVRRLHLPASLVVPELEVVALADRDARRAHVLAEQFGVPRTYDSHRGLIGCVDAALVAVPPAVHSPICSDLLAAGVHVLCEKPLATSSAECRVMIEAARAGRALLATAHSRRFHYNIARLKDLLDLAALGALQSARVLDGFRFSWPTETGYMFSGSTAAGVLMESGIHVIDSLLWLLGPVSNLSYWDDSLGGVESNAEIALSFSTGVTAQVKVSRTTDLANILWLKGERGWAACDLYDGRSLRMHLPDSKVGCALGDLTVASPESHSGEGIMARQLADFAHSVVEGHPPRATAQDGLDAVALVERCYAQRKGRQLPSLAPLPGVVIR